MAHRAYDPLAFVPSSEAIRKKLDETLTLAERLRLLLDLSERLHSSVRTAANPTPVATERPLRPIRTGNRREVVNA